MAPLDDLLDYIFDGRKADISDFYAEFEGWVRGSRRFKAFAIDHRSKIRSKLKNARGAGGISDLRAELETAGLLLREDRFALEYEKYTALKQRGPDFTVTFRTNTPFNVEVRRLRGVEHDAGDNAEGDDGVRDEVESRIAKLRTVLCDKVGQMPPSIINLLWLIAEREVTEDDLTRAAISLRQLAENKDERFFTRRGFKSASDFLKRYQQLSGIVLHQPDANIFWLNALARHKVPPEIINAIRRLKAGSG
jgi:hypothetical protein